MEQKNGLYISHCIQELIYLLLGIKEGCILQPARPYTIEKPVVSLWFFNNPRRAVQSRTVYSYVNIIQDGLMPISLIWASAAVQKAR
jgi:hypothetical protein